MYKRLKNSLPKEVLTLLVILFVTPTLVLAQQSLKRIQQTASYDVYELKNDSLKQLSPLFYSIPSTQTLVIEDIKIAPKSSSILTEEQFNALGYSSLPNDLVIYSDKSGYYKGQSVKSAQLNLIITRNNQTEVVRSIRFRVPKVSEKWVATSNKSAKDFLEFSPFSNGQWYKIPILKTAIYRIDSNYLSELGITNANLDNVQIWATDGKQLPESNFQSRSQLQQIPLVEKDGGLLFYAQDAHSVSYDGSRFDVEQNHFSDSSYVFLTVDQGAGQRITATSTNATVQQTVDTHKAYYWIEEDIYKPESYLKSGQNWFGLRFTNGAGQNDKVILTVNDPFIIANQTTYFSADFAARSTSSGSVSYRVNGQSIGSRSTLAIGSYTGESGDAATINILNTSFALNETSDTYEISARAILNRSDAEAWLDKAIWTVPRELMAVDNHLEFYANALSENENTITRFNMGNFDSEPVVLDVTDPQNYTYLAVNGNATTYSVIRSANQNSHFIAQNSFDPPLVGRPIGNQELVGTSPSANYIIVTNEYFYNQAVEWASYRGQDYDILPIVVTQEQIFNEYSGGKTDPVAIRDYLVHLKNKSLETGDRGPEYLLLFGDATYDYKNIAGGVISNKVITYQSENSTQRFLSFGSDDYFGLLDDNEGRWTSSVELIDIGIGRFTVNTRTDAEILMNKIKLYESDNSLGDWRSRFTFVADDDINDATQDDRDLHTINAEGTADRIDIDEFGIRLNKIYMMSYPVVNTSEGRRKPAATSDFIRAINEGSLVINYSGHGAEQLLAYERVFRSEMIDELTNADKPTIFVTATCDFGRFDSDTEQSGAEKLLTAENGGSVASLTTTRVVRTTGSLGGNTNYTLNVVLSQNMVMRDYNNLPRRLGDIYRDTKRYFEDTSTNSKKFILLGDPAMRMGLPKEKAQLTSINNEAIKDGDVFTLKGLDEVSLSGNIQNADGSVNSTFNGTVSVMVFDAERNVNLESLVNGSCYLPNCMYQTQNDLLFNGEAEVANGLFTLQFRLPRDIQNSIQSGRIVLYARESGTLLDAGGANTQVVFYGLNTEANNDGTGPELQAYLNDMFFVNGGLVNESPTLLVELEDESGINTAGSGIGHDLSATLNTSPPKTYALNEYFKGELNNYKKGQIEFPLADIPTGNHTLTIRAWDTFNNMSEKEIQFEVADTDELNVRSLFNYPNPMNTSTKFIVEHNQIGKPLRIQIRIFTLSGKAVQFLDEEIVSSNSYAIIEWNGRDADMNRLANGTYIYNVLIEVDNASGKKTYSKTDKLVVIH